MSRPSRSASPSASAASWPTARSPSRCARGSWWASSAPTARKSTLFDLITGFTRADAGTVHIDGRDVTRLRPDQICRLGVGRTFQKLALPRDERPRERDDRCLPGNGRRGGGAQAARRRSSALGSGTARPRTPAGCRRVSASASSWRGRWPPGRDCPARRGHRRRRPGAIPGWSRLRPRSSRARLALVVIEHNMRVIDRPAGAGPPTRRGHRRRPARRHHARPAGDRRLPRGGVAV